METGQVIDHPFVAFVVFPTDVGSCGLRLVIGDAVIFQCFGFAVFAAFEFVPGVVGFAVAVFILHDVDDSRFGTARERISRDRKVRPFFVVDAVVEAHDQVTAESAQRNICAFPHSFERIGAGRFRGVFILEAGLGFVDELARGRGVFVYGIAGRQAVLRGGTVVHVHRLDRDRKLLGRFTACGFDRQGQRIGSCLVRLERIGSRRAYLLSAQRPAVLCSVAVFDLRGEGQRKARFGVKRSVGVILKRDRRGFGRIVFVVA